METLLTYFWLYGFPVVLALLGGIIGSTFADIDLAPPLPIKHRSAWTHGPLIPYGLTWLTALYPAYWPFTAAFLLTYAVHLIYDMFPAAWIGGALIKAYPIPLTLPPILSFLYLGVGVAATGYAFTLTPLWRWLLTLVSSI